MSSNTFLPCCLRHFSWTGTPTGTESTLASLPTYISHPNSSSPPDSKAAVLYVHDALGWTFPNARLLCDHFAREANVTVYMPDFFGREVLDREKVLAGKWAELDMEGFQARNARAIREPEILAAARELREKYAKLGAVGYCFGGWAVLRLGAEKLVDCVVCAHPSWVTKDDIDNYSTVPLQFLCPEVDSQFSDDLKFHAFQKLVSRRIAPGDSDNDCFRSWVGKAKMGYRLSGFIFRVWRMGV